MPSIQDDKSSAKTADYTIWPRDDEVAFTNSGATTAITFTLPPVADVYDGWQCEIYGVADYGITITAPAGTLVALGSAGATSLATTSLLMNIGSYVRIRYDAVAAKYLGVVAGQSLKTSTAKAIDYQVLATDDGTVFTTLGAAGTVDFTLPAIAAVTDGWEAEFFSIAAGAMGVVAPAGKLVTFNNAAATSVTLGTASEIIGGGVRIRYDAGATKYLCFLMTEETQTVTVA